MSEQADNKASLPEPAPTSAPDPAFAPAPAPADPPLNKDAQKWLETTPPDANNKQKTNRSTMRGIACILGTCGCFMLMILIHFVLVVAAFSKPLSWSIKNVSLSGLESSGGEFRFDLDVSMTVDNPNGWPMVADINVLTGKVSSLPRINQHPEEMNSSIYDVCEIALPQSVKIKSHTNTTFSLTCHTAVEQKSGHTKLVMRLSEDCTMNPSWETNFRVNVPNVEILGYELPALESEKAVSCSKDQLKNNSTNSSSDSNTNSSSNDSGSLIESSRFHHGRAANTVLHQAMLRLEERLW